MPMAMHPVAIVQARLGSSRLPGKVLKPILGRPMLWHVVQRLWRAPGLAGVVVATSDRPGDEPIRRFCRQSGVAVFAGSEEDVLDRFYRAAAEHGGDPLVRITADCPFVDPDLVGRLLELYGTGAYDHVGIAAGADSIFLDGGRFPDGLDAECFSFAALDRAWREATHPIDREHVTPYIWGNRHVFRCGLLTADQDYATMRWTVDNQADFELALRVYEALYSDGQPFLMADILAFLAEHPELAETNRAFVGQEGYLEVWRARAGTPARKEAV